MGRFAQTWPIIHMLPAGDLQGFQGLSRITLCPESCADMLGTATSHACKQGRLVDKSEVRQRLPRQLPFRPHPFWDVHLVVGASLTLASPTFSDLHLFVSPLVCSGTSNQRLSSSLKFYPALFSARGPCRSRPGGSCWLFLSTFFLSAQSRLFLCVSSVSPAVPAFTSSYSILCSVWLSFA